MKLLNFVLPIFRPEHKDVEKGIELRKYVKVPSSLDKTENDALVVGNKYSVMCPQRIL